jgi:hypothetical protein
VSLAGLVAQAGVEPATPKIGKSCSIYLSYSRNAIAVFPAAICLPPAFTPDALTLAGHTDIYDYSLTAVGRPTETHARLAIWPNLAPFSEAPIQRKAPLFLSRALPSLFRFQHPSTIFHCVQVSFEQPQNSSLGANFAIASPPKVRCSRSIWSLSHRARGNVASLNWSSNDRLPVPLQCVHWRPRLGVPGMR